MTHASLTSTHQLHEVCEISKSSSTHITIWTSSNVYHIQDALLTGS
jgi:hypothetical protein